MVGEKSRSVGRLKCLRMRGRQLYKVMGIHIFTLLHTSTFIYCHQQRVEGKIGKVQDRIALHQFGNAMFGVRSIEFVPLRHQWTPLRLCQIFELTEEQLET